MTGKQESAIRIHGRKLLVIFPNAKERDPVKLCKKLRRFESSAHAIAERLCNGPEYPTEDGADKACANVLASVNRLLGNAREYQPKTGAKCSCKRGQQRDNCGTCEGTGMVVDFARIRNSPPTVPVFINRDPRGYALKIDDAWMREHNADLHKDWGGYGIVAPEIDGEGN